jgi:hypothetical protein
MASKEQLLALAAARYRQLALKECYDPVDLNSRPTAAQLACLQDINRIRHRYVTAGNQAGKSQMLAREVSWLFEDTHPFWSRPANWGNEPLLILVVGRVAKQVEDVLWRKIEAFLEPDSFTIIRVGGQLQKVVHRANGNTILFGSHHNEREAREKLQAFVAHACYLDELPSSFRLLEELHRRVQAKGGPFMATFTPKEPNTQIKAIIDGGTAPLSRKYQFSMLDNPIYTEAKKAEIIESLAELPEAYRNTILYGDWYAGDSRVYHFDRSSMVAEAPGYSASWRHVESVDPALQSKFGYTLWAERPDTGWWYCIRADYIEGSGALTPDAVFEECQRRTRHLNVVRRVSDPHESWFINTASAKGVSYQFPLDKNRRKGELIKGLQSALGTTCFITPGCDILIRELENCQWSETSDRIVNGKSYHCLDASQYFVDCMPRGQEVAAPKTWEAELRTANEVRKRAAKTAVLSGGRVRRTYRPGVRL